MDEGTTCRTASPAPAAVCDERWYLEQALRELETEALSFGARMIQDSSVRAWYMQEIRTMSQDLLKKVANGRMLPADAVKEANLLRNEIMDAARLRSTDLGRAAAERLKQAGRTLVELQEQYAVKLFRKAFNELSEVERDQVFLAIVESAGRSRAAISLRAARFGKLGKGLMVVSLALAVYNVANAEDKVDAAAREGGGLAAGFLGGAGGGAAAGLLCGPGAPVCVTVGVFVGGALGALGFDLTYDRMKR